MEDVTNKYNDMLDNFEGDLVLLDRLSIKVKGEPLFDEDYFKADLSKLRELNCLIKNNMIRIVKL